MSTLKSRKAGTQFGTANVKQSGTLTPEQWAAYMLAAGFPATEKIIAEGLGIISRESNFNTDPGGDGAHFGAWQEDSSFGTQAQRLDPAHSTAAALKRWKADGNSFYPAWGRWQKEQGGVDGATLWKQYAPAARSVIVKASSGGGIGAVIGDILGSPAIGLVSPVGGVINAIGGVGNAVDAAGNAVDFVGDFASTILNFRKLGELAAKAAAWFLRLIAKAIWDYVVAPLVHWNQRAVVYYWETNFSRNPKGDWYEQNAGVITLSFWALGYGLLWSSAEPKAQLAAPARNTLLGRLIRSGEGQAARRNLTKPSKVKEKTPPKPEPLVSRVPITMTTQFSTIRKRPVKVERKGVNDGGWKREGGGFVPTESATAA